MPFAINRDAVLALVAPANAPDLSGINFGMLEMLEFWAEREWAKKEAGKPSEWDQGVWMSRRGEEVTGTACGTACCLAGKAVLITPGVEFAMVDYEWASDGSAVTSVNTNLADFSLDTMVESVLVPVAMAPADWADDRDEVEQNGKKYYVANAEDAGRIILGLNDDESYALFSGANDLARVKQIMSEIREGSYRRARSHRQDVPITVVQRCGVRAQDELAEIVGERTDAFYRVNGSCVLPENHGEGILHLYA